MPGIPFTPEERAVLAPYVNRPVTDWSAVMAKLHGRTLFSARSHLQRLRDDHALFRCIPTGGAAQWWREVA